MLRFAKTVKFLKLVLSSYKCQAIFVNIWSFFFDKQYMLFLFLVFQIFQHFVNFKLVLPFMLFFAASGYSFDNGKLGTVCETLGRPSKYGCMYKYSLAVWAVRCVISSWGQLIFVLLSIHVLVWTHLFNYWSLLEFLHDLVLVSPLAWIHSLPCCLSTIIVHMLYLKFLFSWWNLSDFI